MHRRVTGSCILPGSFPGRLRGAAVGVRTETEQMYVEHAVGVHGDCSRNGEGSVEGSLLTNMLIYL